MCLFYNLLSFASAFNIADGYFASPLIALNLWMFIGLLLVAIFFILFASTVFNAPAFSVIVPVIIAFRLIIHIYYC